MLRFSAKFAGLSSNYRIQNSNYRLAFFVVSKIAFCPRSLRIRLLLQGCCPPTEVVLLAD